MPTLHDVLLSGNDAEGVIINLFDGSGSGATIFNCDGATLANAAGLTFVSPVTLANIQTLQFASGGSIDLGSGSLQGVSALVMASSASLVFEDNSGQLLLRGSVFEMNDGSGSGGGPFRLDGALIDFGANGGGSPSNPATPLQWMQINLAGSTAWLPVYQ